MERRLALTPRGPIFTVATSNRLCVDRVVLLVYSGEADLHHTVGIIHPHSSAKKSITATLLSAGKSSLAPFNFGLNVCAD